MLGHTIMHACMFNMDHAHDANWVVQLFQFHETANNCSDQVEALKSDVITKPVVAWVSGTCAQLFRSEVQFGHAGARSGGAQESAQVPAAQRISVQSAGSGAAS